MTHPATGPELLVLCTGNAARSVMAGYMLEHRARAAGRELVVVTAGTHTLDGQPMGLRTRAALASIPELAGAPTSSHRSRQIRPADAVRADLVVAMEADHVRFVRRRHPEAAGRTASLRRLVRELSPGPAPLGARLAALDLAGAELAPWEDVADPAGGDESVYLACVRELWALTAELLPLL